MLSRVQRFLVGLFFIASCDRDPPADSDRDAAAAAERGAGASEDRSRDQPADGPGGPSDGDMDAGSSGAGSKDAASVDARSDGKVAATCAPEVTLEALPANVMIAAPKIVTQQADWKDVRGGLSALIAAPAAQIGVHLFDAEGATISDAGAPDNLCGAARHLFSPPSGDGGQTLSAWLDEQAKDNPTPYFSFRPLIAALARYLAAPEPWPRSDAPSYLVLLLYSDDNCFGRALAEPTAKAPIFKKLARDLSRRNVHLVTVSWGDGRDATSQAFASLVPEGVVDKVYTVRDSVQFASVAAEIAGSTRSCRYHVSSGASAGVNLSVTLDDEALVRDRTRRSGWDFVDPEHRLLELFGSACSRARAGTSVRARRDGCDCARTLTSVAAEKRALSFFVQDSLALAMCIEPDQNTCLQQTGQSWWNVLGTALVQVITNPAFDQLEYGLRFSRGPSACAALETPEVPEGPGTELAILRAMLGTPSGSAALLAGMEQIAQRTSPLLAGERRSLIVVGDGSDGCGSVDSNGLSTRLSAAASKLAQAGVRVYPVGLGGQADDATKAANLRTVAGPAAADDAGTPYLDGGSMRNELLGIIERYAHTLDSCALRLSELAPGDDRASVRLFLDGEPLAFDDARAKQRGWGWTNADRGEIELYGQACEQFKKTGRAAIGAEASCKP